MRAAIKQVCAANVSLIICRQGNCPDAASRQKSKKHTTAASRHLPKRGNCRNIKGRAVEASGLFVVTKNNRQSIIEKLVWPVLAQYFYEFALGIENNDFLSAVRSIGVCRQITGLFRDKARKLIRAFPLRDEFWRRVIPEGLVCINDDFRFIEVWAEGIKGKCVFISRDEDFAGIAGKCEEIQIFLPKLGGVRRNFTDCAGEQIKAKYGLLFFVESAGGQ